jgi:hypothetical protein
MTDEIKLARRAVASPHWRWAPGMLSRCSTDTRRAAYRWLAGLDTRHYGIVCVVEDKHRRPCRSVGEATSLGRRTGGRVVTGGRMRSRAPGAAGRTST